MAHDRAGTGRWAWLKGVGTAEAPLRPDWRLNDAHLLTNIWFTKYPRSVRAGDLLVYYAAKWQRLPAIVELASDDVLDDGGAHPVHGQRFRWKMHVRPIVAAGLDQAPHLRETDIASSRVKRLSHILLHPDEYSPIRQMLLDAASDELVWSLTGAFPMPVDKLTI